MSLTISIKISKPKFDQLSVNLLKYLMFRCAPAWWYGMVWYNNNNNNK